MEKAFMRDVSEEIIELGSSLKETDTLESITSRFYAIMRSYNIKQGRKSGNGGAILCDNPEWVMCSIMLNTLVSDWFDWENINSVPEDLQV